MPWDGKDTKKRLEKAWTGYTIFYDIGKAPKVAHVPLPSIADSPASIIKKRGIGKLNKGRESVALPRKQFVDRQERPHSTTRKPNSIDTDSWKAMREGERTGYVETEQQESDSHAMMSEDRDAGSSSGHTSTAEAQSVIDGGPRSIVTQIMDKEGRIIEQRTSKSARRFVSLSDSASHEWPNVHRILTKDADGVVIRDLITKHKHMKSTASGPVLILRAAPAKLKRKRGDMLLRVRRLDDSAIMPTRSAYGTAGCDICSPSEYLVPAKGRIVVMTKLSFAVPSGTYARTATGPGLATRSVVDVGTGAVDLDYRGEIGIVLFNHGDEDYKLKGETKLPKLHLRKYL